MRVENLRTYAIVVSEQAVFIGRPSLLGNPYRIGPDGTREQVIERYRVWLHTALLVGGAIRVAFEELRGVDVLLCYCAPLACHGDVLVEQLEQSA